MYFAGALYKILGIDFKILDSSLRKLKNFTENLNEAKEGYDSEKRILGLGKLKNQIDALYSEK